MARVLAAPAGVTVIFGPSGAGKTTILECVAGLPAPDSGVITLADEAGATSETLFDSTCHADLSPQQRRIGYVFQQLALFPHMRAEENIAFGIRGNRAQKETLVRCVLKRFRIAHAARPSPGDNSSNVR